MSVVITLSPGLGGYLGGSVTVEVSEDDALRSYASKRVYVAGTWCYAPMLCIQAKPAREAACKGEKSSQLTSKGCVEEALHMDASTIRSWLRKAYA